MSKPPRFIVDEDGIAVDRKLVNEYVERAHNEARRDLETMKAFRSGALPQNPKVPDKVMEAQKKLVKELRFENFENTGKSGAIILFLGYLCWSASYGVGSLWAFILTGLAIVLFVIGGMFLLDGMITGLKGPP